MANVMAKRKRKEKDDGEGDVKKEDNAKEKE